MSPKSDLEAAPPPQWALSAIAIGQELASMPNVQAGDKALTCFLSVPTGQYLGPLMMAGAFMSPPKIADPCAVVGETFRAVSFDGSSQIRDVDVTLTEEEFFGGIQLMYRSDGYLRSTSHPVLRLPEGVPDDRTRKVLADRDWEEIRRQFRKLPKGTAKSAENWWTTHCLSPVVIVGESLEFVDIQRQIILERASHWIDPRVLPVLEYSKPGTQNRERVLHHPYSYLTIDSARISTWLQAFRPRLVIYTSWWAYFRRKMSAFAGVPTIVIVNRRVSAADIAASMNTHHDPSVRLAAAASFPRSFGLRLEQSEVSLPEYADDVATTDDVDREFGDD